MLALSTSWNTNCNNSGKQIVDEIRNLGFGYIELCFSHTQREVNEIYKNQGIRVISLHNFCPVPDGLPRKKALPDCYSLSSPDTYERETAIKFAKRTVLTAKRLKAKAVVLHTGRVEIHDYTKELVNLKHSNKKNTCQFESLRELALKQRKTNKQKFLDSIFLSIRELADFAFNLGIKLGIENRIYIREIPNFDEIKIFLDNFAKKGVGYWHDTGHAYILSELGLTKHLDYLKTYKKNLLGIHLHDVKNLKDHKAPFSGEIDFKEIKPYLKKDTIKVIEAHKPATAKEIILAKKKLEALFN
ncbi:MAG: sugar phosphate isomerase/epimerase [Candidatus Omnitrophica bacterium]|nr:sugar phosphate isomerase/epimerase [Candidatus Omnitrophota bacterium]MDD5352308.1 sugar phosphate isomerase/epimerase [Candidatus Omnitrophota bacterium]MDD5549906.1 sugar phosphate isomerase/epimerase [Candidatus Omnitrophota bacterium]